MSGRATQQLRAHPCHEADNRDEGGISRGSMEQAGYAFLLA
jgi:hypothetical protein